MAAERTRQYHPLHPALVHFPIACWVLAVALDLLAQVAAIRIPGIESAAAAHALLWAGVAASLPAMGAGAIDYLRAPAKLRCSPLLAHHVGWMSATWCVWLLAGMLRAEAESFTEPASLAVMLLEIAGVVGLTVGGAIAGRMVYMEGVP